MEALVAALDEALRGSVRRDEPLASLTTYRLGGPAAVYVEPADLADLQALTEVVRATAPSVPILVLGRGSNVVVSDEGWPGIALRLSANFSWTGESGGAGAVAGGATPLPQVANWAARRGLSGLEFFISIPGSVGGAVRMNAGAHGGEVAGRLVTATILDLDRGEVLERAAADLGFSYRKSDVGEREVVVEARFELVPDEPAVVKARMEDFRRYRAETQPPAVQNAGSTFKNPPGDHAGRLVDAAGLKGFRVGGVAVSNKHANFFVAERGARAQDVHDLVREVAGRVEERFGVRLEPEVRFAGRFERTEVGT